MRRMFRLPLLLVVVLGQLAGASRRKDRKPVRVIIDTDLSIDCDDVAALCIAHALMDAGEIEILAILHNAGVPQGVGAVSVLNHYYDHDDIPLGAYKGKFGLMFPDMYVGKLMEQFDSPIRNFSQVPDAVEVYRRVLAAQPDNSVAIASIGFMTNLANLLNSKPDNFSDLTGSELIEKKVSRIGVMGGKYPDSWASKIPEWNFGAPGFTKCDYGLTKKSHRCSSSSANFTVENLPKSIPTFFSGFELGKKISTGAKMSTCQPESNPCRAAYIIRQGYNKTRFSWDPETVLVSIFGAMEEYFETHGTEGVNSVDPLTGHNRWISSSEGNEQSYLSAKEGKAGVIADMIDELLCQDPRAHWEMSSPTKLNVKN